MTKTRTMLNTNSKEWFAHKYNAATKTQQLQFII